MKRNLKVLQINGFRGLLIALFTVSCLIAGFIAFPAFLTMNTWNYLSITTSSVPQINFAEGTLLWAIIIFSLFVFNKKKFIVSFNTKQELTDDEVQEVVAKIKAQTVNNELLQLKKNNAEIKNDEPLEKTMAQPENKEN